VTDDDRLEGTEGTKDTTRGKSDESTKHGAREKGGAEEVNPEGEGTAGGVKENVQDEFKEAQQD
jgi:hypothetical protein